ncbi:hypothetical protein GQ53DRAFT_837938 [Thozetella sp. PMI_491]|nr:hypothetical protein GQ53DRAFT_837938 [Thozetella sp. PMI_491]
MGSDVFASLQKTLLICDVVIVTVLAVFDGHALPNLPMDITLNTLLAFLTTCTKAAFMVPVGEAVSQWKWNIFASSSPAGLSGRPLADFQVLDAASRGTWGSWILIRRFKWKHFVSFAAVFSLLSIVTSPITQQMIQYPTRSTAIIGDARVSISDAFDVLDQASLEIAISASQSGLSGQQDSVKAVCSSATCTFPKYNSLALCARVQDISKLLHVTRIPNSNSTDWTGAVHWNVVADNGTTAYNASLPNGVSLSTPVAYSYLSAPMDTSISFSNDSDLGFSSVGHLYIIYSNAGNVSYPRINRTNEAPWQFQAVEVLFHMCVNTYSTAVTSGNSSTEIIVSSYSPYPVSGNLGLYNVACNYSKFGADAVACDDIHGAARGQSFFRDPSDDAHKFSVDRHLAAILSMELAQGLFATMAWDGGDGDLAVHTSAEYRSMASSIYGEDWALRDVDTQMARLEAYYNGTAVSVTNRIRTANTANYTSGTAWVDETYVHIRWAWAAFIAAQMLMSYILLAATVAWTYRLRVAIVKSSALSSMLAATDSVRAAVGTAANFKEVEGRAKTVLVRLENGQLVLAERSTDNC